MRAVILTMAAAMALGGTVAPATAWAQAGNTAGLVDLPGVAPTETSPIRRMQKKARAWVAEERARQKAKPGDLVELAFEIETNIGPAILKLAERERIDTHDLIMAIMYDITKGASDEIAADLRRMRKAGAPEAEVQEAAARQAALDAKVAEVVKSQSVVSRALVANM
jgi:hypothetical protein